MATAVATITAVGRCLVSAVKQHDATERRAACPAIYSIGWASPYGGRSAPCRSSSTYVLATRGHGRGHNYCQALSSFISAYGRGMATSSTRLGQESRTTASTTIAVCQSRSRSVSSRHVVCLTATATVSWSV